MLIRCYALAVIGPNRDQRRIAGFARREVKPGKEPPPNWVEVDHDETTGKRIGWEPIVQSSFSAFFEEAVSNPVTDELTPGTYELCGPKINGNPERLDRHQLIRHGHFGVLLSQRWLDGPITADDLFSRFPDAVAGGPAQFPMEGVVWHHPDGRMAKLKRRDFPR